MNHARVSAHGWVPRFAIILALLGTTPLVGCERTDPVESEECQAEIAEWRSALEEANNTIERLNASIEEAQGYAGSSYGEMRSALEDLETGDPVSEP